MQKMREAAQSKKRSPSRTKSRGYPMQNKENLQLNPQTEKKMTLPRKVNNKKLIKSDMPKESKVHREKANPAT